MSDSNNGWKISRQVQEILKMVQEKYENFEKGLKESTRKIQEKFRIDHCKVQY